MLYRVVRQVLQTNRFNKIGGSHQPRPQVCRKRRNLRINDRIESLYRPHDTIISKMIYFVQTVNGLWVIGLPKCPHMAA